MVRVRKLAARDYRAVKKIERIIVEEYLRYLKETGEEDTIQLDYSRILQSLP